LKNPDLTLAPFCDAASWHAAKVCVSQEGGITEESEYEK
jgi:hypothetical protein